MKPSIEGRAATPLAAATTNVSAAGAEAAAPIAARQYRQIALISVAALALYLGLRWMPTGTNLSHMDFRVDAPDAIEFCDPSNPQFIPVVAVASPVTLSVQSPPAAAGDEVRATAVLRTASGKAIAPEDLLVVHTERLHLLIADPSLQDYQHVHPEPGRTPGEWTFAFTPHAAGTYRVFADFTPAATGRGLYSHADLEVSASGGASGMVHGTDRIDRDARASAGSVERGGYRFALTPTNQPIRAKQPADLKFQVTRLEGGAVPLLPVMDAFAHLVAFDETRSGFAHLHPAQLDLTRPPDAERPVLDFKITIPTAGLYVIWAQVNLGGQEMFVPFWFDVAP